MGKSTAVDPQGIGFVTFLPMCIHEVRKLSLSIRSRAVAQLVRGELVGIVFALPVDRDELPKDEA